jgi:hypothetical protein
MQISNTNLIASFSELQKFLLKKMPTSLKLFAIFIVDQFQIQAASLYKQLRMKNYSNR